MYETEEERMMRLQVKYYDMLISEVSAEKNIEESQAQKKEELEANRTEAIDSFRRVKFRLEKRYRNISADQLLFTEHEQLGKALDFESKV